MKPQFNPTEKPTRFSQDFSAASFLFRCCCKVFFITLKKKESDLVWFPLAKLTKENELKLCLATILKWVHERLKLDAREGEWIMLSDERIIEILNSLGAEQKTEFIHYLQTLQQAQEDERLPSLEIPA